MMEMILVPPPPSRDIGSRKVASPASWCPSLQWALPPNRRAQDAMRLRVLARLEERIDTACRAMVEQHLPLLAPKACASILPGGTIRARMGVDLFAGLSPHALVGLLQPADPVERATLARLVGAGNPMVREAALDALSGAHREGELTGKVQSLCAEHLRPGLALLDGDHEIQRSPASSEENGQLIHPEREARFLRSLRADEPTASAEILASHALLTTAQVAGLISSRDPLLLVALAWRAGYSMRAALLLQTQLAGVPPGTALTSDRAGGPPLERRALTWQLDSLQSASAVPESLSVP